MVKNRAPCPNCASYNVRWRNRRFYDGALNFIDTMLTGATVVRTNDGISPYAHSGMDAGFMRDRQIQEQKRMIGRKTARRFWRCPDCRQHGEGIEEL